MNLSKTAASLEKNGYKVSVFASLKEADRYLNEQIDSTTVGIGGSVTIDEMGSFKSLSEHNQVYWHWYPQNDLTVDETRKKAQDTAIYLSSVNAVSEDGEMVNIDGAGNRLASTLYGHEKVYFIVSANKITENLHQAIERARNVAAPLNASRLNCKTPCAVKSDHCYDCKSDDRICNAMVIHYKKMMSCEMEVILIEESAGY